MGEIVHVMASDDVRSTEAEGRLPGSGLGALPGVEERHAERNTENANNPRLIDITGSHKNQKKKTPQGKIPEEL